MKPRIIAFGGKRGAGKTHLANWLHSEHQFVRRKFSEPIREHLIQIMMANGADNYVHAVSYFEYPAKEQPCKYLYGKTPREALKSLGAWGRENVDQDIWVDPVYTAICRILNMGNSVVVDDVRYPNELRALQSLGAYTFYVNGGVTTDVDPTENSIDRYFFDETLEPTGCLDDTYVRINKVLKPEKDFRVL